MTIEHINIIVRFSTELRLIAVIPIQLKFADNECFSPIEIFLNMPPSFIFLLVPVIPSIYSSF
jgi:hypothetical protein